MNLSAMRTRTRVYIDDRGTTSTNQRFSDTELTNLLNAAQEEVQKVMDDADEMYFSACQTYTVVRSDTSYEFTLPTDFKKVVTAERLSDNDVYDPIPAKWVTFATRHFEAPPTTYRPLGGDVPCCYLRGTKLGVVNPAANYTLRLWYTKKIADLSADSDTSDIPTEFHNLICLYAAKLGAMSEGRALKPEFLVELQDEIARLAMHVESRQKQQVRGVHYVEEY